jgi:hypothetical protein
MEIRPSNRTPRAATRGSGPGARRRRSAALGPRKDVIIRLPEEVAQQLKLVAVYERTTIQDFCVQAILPSLAKALKKHGLTPPEP